MNEQEHIERLKKLLVEKDRAEREKIKNRDKSAG